MLTQLPVGSRCSWACGCEYPHQRPTAGKVTGLAANTLCLFWAQFVKNFPEKGGMSKGERARRADVWLLSCTSQSSPLAATEPGPLGICLWHLWLLPSGAQALDTAFLVAPSHCLPSAADSYLPKIKQRTTNKTLSFIPFPLHFQNLILTWSNSLSLFKERRGLISFIGGSEGKGKEERK